MSETSMTLNEARNALRKLVDWSDAISRLRGVLDAAANLEENIAAYDKMQMALAEEVRKAQAAHADHLADLAATTAAEDKTLDAHKAQTAAAKADLSKQLSIERDAATKLVQVFKEKASEVMDQTRAEQTMLQKELDELRKVHKTLEDDVKALRAERQRVLTRFSAA